MKPEDATQITYLLGLVLAAFGLLVFFAVKFGWLGFAGWLLALGLYMVGESIFVMCNRKRKATRSGDK